MKRFIGVGRTGGKAWGHLRRIHMLVYAQLILNPHCEDEEIDLTGGVGDLELTSGKF